MSSMMQKTLVELLLALQTSSKLALAITCRCAWIYVRLDDMQHFFLSSESWFPCSSRDALDAVISALSTTTSFSIVAMVS
jgi:hypothetical protein